MVLVPVPGAGRVWALPFLSVLAPSERYAAQRGKHHKKITDWARQMLLLVRRWWPEREIVAVADSCLGERPAPRKLPTLLAQAGDVRYSLDVWTLRSTIPPRHAELGRWVDHA